MEEELVCEDCGEKGDDASVARLKGPGRPVNTLEQRMMVLAALRSVDWVVPFSEDTPIRLLERIKPDVLVKGGDYQRHEVVGAENVLAYGGEVTVLDFQRGYSTSAVIEKIQAEEPV